MFLVDPVFDRRYYHWCLSEWKREIKNEYPLLKLVQEDSTIKIMKELEEAQRIILTKALIKRGVNQGNLEQIMEQLEEDKRIMLTKALIRRSEYLNQVIGEEYTEEEKKYVDYFLQESRRLRNVFVSHMNIEDFNYHIKIDKKRFKQYIIEALTPVLGKDVEILGGGEFSICTPIGAWNLITRIDIGSRHFNLCYDHAIKSKNGKKVADNISLLGWLGIMCQTDWQYLSNDDLKPTAESLAILCEHFMRAVPHLIENIIPE